MTRESSQQEGTALRSESNFGEKFSPRKALLPKLQELVDSEDFGDVCTIQYVFVTTPPWGKILSNREAVPFPSASCVPPQFIQYFGQ